MSRESFRIDGQVGIVTGGCSGLGQDIADALAGSGSHVIVTSRDLQRARAAAERLATTHGIEAVGLELDQRDFRATRRFAEAAFAWKGRIDVLVNNAGGGSGATTGNLFSRNPEDINDLIATNLTGVIFVCREVGRFMANARSGKIINIASVAAIVGRKRGIYRRHNVNEQPVDYAAAKAGVLGLTRDLAAFLADYDIQVNAISPGGFDKGTLPRGFVDEYAGMTLQRRMGRMGQDIKGAVLFLASTASDHVIGHNLVVDGGFSCTK